MHFLMPALLALVAAAVLGSGYRAAVEKRRRLERLVTREGKSVEASQIAEDRITLVERFLPRAIRRRLRLVGIEVESRRTVLAAALACVPVLAVALALGPLLAFGLALILLAVALMALNLIAERRVAELAAQLPGFFDRLRQLLIVGNSLPTAFTRAAQNAQPRLRVFFSPTIRRLGNGASFSESIRQCADDIGLYEMRLFATAVAANLRFGGSLTHSLNNLVSYLRKRGSIERELRANTAQIRASAWVLGLLPMLVAGLIIVENREYALWFIAHPTGKHMLVYCLLSQIIGAVLMRAIVRTKF